MGGEFVVSYAPQPVLASIARWRSVLRQRLISLGLSLAIGFAVWYFFRDNLGSLGPWMVAVSSVTGVFWIGAALGGWLVARGELRRVGQGPALAVTRDGIWIVGSWLAWPQVGGFRAAPRNLGRSPDLVIELRDGQSADLPLYYLDALPATIDSAIRALSGGRAWIDLSRLDD